MDQNVINVKIAWILLITVMLSMTFTTGCSKNDETLQNKEGQKSFLVKVTDKEGVQTVFDIISDKRTVGEALAEEKLIEGVAGLYGTYITKVNGIEAIYEKDGTYWSFYINGEYAMSSVDTTNIEDGAEYELKVEGN